MKTVIIALLALQPFVAQAKTILHEPSGRAVIYQSQGDNINALTCEHVTEAELLASDVTKVLLKCVPLSKSGYGRENINAHLNEIKASMLVTIQLFDGLMNGLVQLFGGKPDPEASAKNFATEKTRIEALSADEIFGELKNESRRLGVEKVRTVDNLNEEINSFLNLATP